MVGELYVLRITQDADEIEGRLAESPHIERWIRRFTCEDGLETTEDPAGAMTFPTREAAREFWLIECPTGYPWDFMENEISQPLTRYTVMIEEQP